MKGLAWDDEPQDFMNQLANRFGRDPFNIRLDVVDRTEAFQDRFLEDRWDFVVLDLLEDDKPTTGRTQTSGVDLAKFVNASVLQRYPDLAPNYPVFIVSQLPEKGFKQGKSLFPSNAIIRSKAPGPSWTAQDILVELKRRGVYVNHRKVFLIWGGSSPANEQVENHLMGQGLEVAKIDPGKLMDSITHGLLDTMNECGAVIAVCLAAGCTQDDGGNFRTYPRQNVTLEMGMALGLASGTKRLIVLQEWPEDNAKHDRQVHLPSDLGGQMTLRFKDNISETYSALDIRLKALGML